MTISTGVPICCLSCTLPSNTSIVNTGGLSLRSSTFTVTDAEPERAGVPPSIAVIMSTYISVVSLSSSSATVISPSVLIAKASSEEV